MKWTDAWGVDFAISDMSFKDSAYPVAHPIESVNEIDKLHWPDPNDEQLFLEME